MQSFNKYQCYYYTKNSHIKPSVYHPTKKKRYLCITFSFNSYFVCLNDFAWSDHNLRALYEIRIGLYLNILLLNVLFIVGTFMV